MLKLAYCIDTLQVGGTELNAIRTVEQLDRRRFDLVVFHLHEDGPLRARYEACGARMIHLPIRSLYGAATIRQGARLAKLVRAEGVQVFHSHDIYCNIFGVPWARLAGVPAVVASRRWWDASPRRSHQTANRLAYRFAHRIVANSDSVAQLVVDEGVARGRVVTIPNFISDAAFDPAPDAWRLALRRELALPDDAQVIGCVARLSPVKDHASLVLAMALLAPRHPMARLVLIGDGECRLALESLVRDQGLAGRVHFAGMRPNTPNPHWLFDVSVLSSLSEGFPNSVVEAMAASRPVVATRAGGIPDAVTDGESGVLVAPRDVHRMAEAIDMLLSSPARREAMGAVGQAFARSHFAQATVVGRLSDWYESLV